MNKKQSPEIFSYRAQKSMILTFAVLLILAVMTFVASEDDSVQLVPPAEAQTTTPVSYTHLTLPTNREV